MKQSLYVGVFLPGNPGEGVPQEGEGVHLPLVPHRLGFLVDKHFHQAGVSLHASSNL
jgi:hypothetical protein